MGACVGLSLVMSAICMAVVAFCLPGLRDPVSYVEVPNVGQNGTASAIERTRRIRLVAISKWHKYGSTVGELDINDPHLNIDQSIVDGHTDRRHAASRRCAAELTGTCKGPAEARRRAA